MRPQEAGDGLESIVEFQVQIKGHNKREYEDKWQGWQNWTDEKLATKLTQDDQQPVLLLPARWWPDTLPEFESGGWWQRLHKRVRCRQCKCSLVENPSFKSSKCLHLFLSVVKDFSKRATFPIVCVNWFYKKAVWGVVKSWKFEGTLRCSKLLRIRRKNPMKWVLSFSRDYWVYLDITLQSFKIWEFWGEFWRIETFYRSKFSPATGVMN